ncbi:MAG: homoserine kinase [Porticoccaceae bacterium]|nr:homoserine kinase [Pseudomonadota bacterium]
MALHGKTAMAVHTPVSADLLRPLARDLGLILDGEPLPVAAGIENSTFFFTATAGGAIRPYVLSLVEMADAGQARFAARLSSHLAERGLPVPAPLPDARGLRVHQLAGKPALVFPRVPGHHPAPPTAGHCATIGRFLGRAHRAAADLADPPANRRGLAWLAESARDLEPLLDGADRRLLAVQLSRYRQLAAREADLPRGAIHGDLFQDNSLFEGDELRGVIDFYNACHDWLLLDLAIVANDWCAADGGGLDVSRLAALVNAYRAVRPLTAAEVAHWPGMLAIAATRFWVSRLLGRAGMFGGAGYGADKDPAEYRDKLLAITATPPSLP